MKAKAASRAMAMTRPASGFALSSGAGESGASADSGAPLVGSPQTGTLGSIQSGALESSNVDLTQELVNMITAQRVYQANAQTVRTHDQLLQTIVNLR